MLGISTKQMRCHEAAHCKGQEQPWDVFYLAGGEVISPAWGSVSMTWPTCAKKKERPQTVLHVSERGPYRMQGAICFVADTLQETGVVGTTSYLSSGRGEPRIGLAASVLQNDNP